MEKDFIPYQEALELKQLGFNEDCIASWLYGRFNIQEQNGLHWSFIRNSNLQKDNCCTAPTYSQAFRFFREKKILGEVRYIDDWDICGFSITMEDAMSPFFIAHSSIYTEYTTYEETELACVRKLIEIVKQNQP
jgi:hypothetical protein